jgi:hypothetical protein
MYCECMRELNGGRYPDIVREMGRDVDGWDHRNLFLIRFRHEDEFSVSDKTLAMEFDKVVMNPQISESET